MHPAGGMSDIRFQSFEDDDLADIWYALADSATRHPVHFQKLRDQCFQELMDRRGEGLNPWLEKRLKGVPGSRAHVAAAEGTLQEEQIKMTAKEFLDLSTKLFTDMKAWVAEAAKGDTLSASDLAMINASMKIVERVTLKEAEIKPATGN